MTHSIVRPGRKLPFIERDIHLNQHADNWTNQVTDRLNRSSIVANNTVDVFDVSDFPSPVDGVIAVDPFMYIVKSPIELASRFELPENGTFRIDTINSDSNIVFYTGGETLFSTAEETGAVSLFVENSTITSVVPGATLFDNVGTNIGASPFGVVFTQTSRSGFDGFTHLGKTENTSIFFLDTIIQGFSTGYTLSNCVEIVIDTVLMVSDFTVNGPILTIKGDTDRSNISSLTFIARPGQQGFRIDPAIPNGSRLQIINAAVRGGGDLFDTSGLAGRVSGTFTAVADASISATSIASVSSSTAIPGGTSARFHHSGTDVFVGQIVTVSGYANNTNYNTTAKVIRTGSGFFELYDTLFKGNEAGGSYESNSVTLTDTGTNLLDGDTLTIDTDMSIDYDGGSYVYNVQTNSFQINAVFTEDMAGSWSTAGLDQKDPRVLLSASPDFGGSAYIGCGFVNDNSAPTTISSSDFLPIDFGTMTESSSSERWKITNTDNGYFQYFGNEPFNGDLTFDFSVVTASSNEREYLFKIEKMTNGEWEDLDDIVEMKVGVKNTIQFGSKTFPILVEKGDFIRIAVKGVSTTTPMTVSYSSVYMRG